MRLTLFNYLTELAVDILFMLFVIGSFYFVDFVSSYYSVDLQLKLSHLLHEMRIY